MIKCSDDYLFFPERPIPQYWRYSSIVWISKLNYYDSLGYSKFQNQTPWISRFLNLQTAPLCKYWNPLDIQYSQYDWQCLKKEISPDNWFLSLTSNECKTPSLCTTQTLIRLKSNFWWSFIIIVWVLIPCFVCVKLFQFK